MRELVRIAALQAGFPAQQVVVFELLEDTLRNAECFADLPFVQAQAAVFFFEDQAVFNQPAGGSLVFGIAEPGDARAVVIFVQRGRVAHVAFVDFGQALRQYLVFEAFAEDLQLERSDGLAVVVGEGMDDFSQGAGSEGERRRDKSARFAGGQEHGFPGLGLAQRRQFVIDFLDIGQVRLESVEQFEPVGADSQQHMHAGGLVQPVVVRGIQDAGLLFQGMHVAHGQEHIEQFGELLPEGVVLRFRIGKEFFKLVKNK